MYVVKNVLNIQEIMAYLLEGYNAEYKSWVDYFDIAITHAQKPTFFLAGTTLREVDRATGTLKFSQIKHDAFEKGAGM